MEDSLCLMQSIHARYRQSIQSTILMHYFDAKSSGSMHRISPTSSSARSTRKIWKKIDFTRSNRKIFSFACILSSTFYASLMDKGIGNDEIFPFNIAAFFRRYICKLAIEEEIYATITTFQQFTIELREDSNFIVMLFQLQSLFSFCIYLIHLIYKKGNNSNSLKKVDKWISTRKKTKLFSFSSYILRFLCCISISINEFITSKMRTISKLSEKRFQSSAKISSSPTKLFIWIDSPSQRRVDIIHHAK